MFIRNRQPVLCQSCGVWINTNHVVEQACERAQGPHLQCNRCLSYNGQNRGPSNSRPNLQRPPPQSGNRPSLPSQPSSGMNNAGIAQSSNIVNRDGQFAASLFPRRSYFPPQTARMPTSHGQNRAEAAPGPTNLQTQRQIGTGHDTASNPPLEWVLLRQSLLAHPHSLPGGRRVMPPLNKICNVKQIWQRYSRQGTVR